MGDLPKEFREVCLMAKEIDDALNMLAKTEEVDIRKIIEISAMRRKMEGRLLELTKSLYIKYRDEIVLPKEYEVIITETGEKEKEEKDILIKFQNNIKSTEEIIFKEEQKEERINIVVYSSLIKSLISQLYDIIYYAKSKWYEKIGIPPLTERIHLVKQIRGEIDTKIKRLEELYTPFRLYFKEGYNKDLNFLDEFFSRFKKCYLTLFNYFDQRGKKLLIDKLEGTKIGFLLKMCYLYEKERPFFEHFFETKKQKFSPTTNELMEELRRTREKIMMLHLDNFNIPLFPLGKLYSGKTITDYYFRPDKKDYEDFYKHFLVSILIRTMPITQAEERRSVV